ncbi:carboxypeptidase-like regulatory domain-containing protein [Marinoscillum furvescens]|nr:carboxypeptidase-like regulatory domain-containing protein [Marinoscillum furvescens]
MKNQLTTTVFMVALALLWLASCQQPEPSSPFEEVSANANSPQEASGLLLDLSGAPVPDASVLHQSQVIATTDADGAFQIPAVLLDQNAILTFSHPQYVTVIRRVQPNSKLIFYLNEAARAIRLPANEGGTIPLGDAGRASIPPQAFVQPDGSPAVGDVNVIASFVDVSDSRQVRGAPGTFIADNNGELIPLESFGMLELTATTNEGTELSLAQGAAINVELPLIMENTPDRVNLYSLNEETGLWELDGELSNTGNSLQGEITNTGIWNADEPCADSLVCVKVKIDDPNNLGCGVAAEGLSYAGWDGLYTPDADGYVYFNVCPNSVIELQACFPLCIPCPGPVYTATIDLNTVTMNPNGCTDLGVFVLN